MVSADTNTIGLPKTIPSSNSFLIVRRRIRFALNRAQDGLLDYDTMDDISIALTNALREMDEIEPESSNGTDPPGNYKELVTVYHEICSICGEKPREPLAVDRCHRTGRVRGLLCRRCHAAVEFLDADPYRAQKLADYLKDSPREEEN
jgi:hypothetical protein